MYHRYRRDVQNLIGSGIRIVPVPNHWQRGHGSGILKGTVSRDFFSFGFFHESVSLKPLSIPLGPFQIFSKIRGDIRS